MFYPVSDTSMDIPCPISEYIIFPIIAFDHECDFCGKMAEWKVTFQRYAKMTNEWTKEMCDDCYTASVPENIRNNVT